MSAASEKKNSQLQMIYPELASKYAQYPLTRDSWLMVDGTGPDSAPGFVAQGDANTKKEHYVYGNGPNGNGYYHLLTRESYQILHRRVSSEAPAFCCTCFSGQSTRDTADAWQTTKTIVYNRSVATVPNDQVAAKEVEKIAREIAQGTYNRTQNEQLVIHAILLAT